MQHVPLYAAHLYDAVILYATALNATIHDRNLTSPADITEAAKDGRSLFQRIIDKRKYQSEYRESLSILLFANNLLIYHNFLVCQTVKSRSKSNGKLYIVRYSSNHLETNLFDKYSSLFMFLH